MRNLIYILIFITELSLFISCKKEVDLPVLTEEEYPRILGRWPEKVGGNPGTLGGNVGREFRLSMQFTPSNLCEGIWYVDDIEYVKGTDFVYNTDVPKTHRIKLVVKTPKYTASREAILVITK